MSVRSGDGPDHSNQASPPAGGTLDFDKVTLRSFLDHDTRPTFVLDARIGDAPPSRIVYRNRSMRQKYPDDACFNQAFWAWTGAGTQDEDLEFRGQDGVAWTRVSLESRYTVIAGSKSNTGSPGDAAASHNAVPMSRELSRRSDTRQSVYETLRSTLPSTEYIKFFLTFDWSKSSLGPLESWSDEMISATRLLLIDPRPGAMMIGSDYSIIYNEPYFPIVGLRHPAALGKPFAVCYPEVPPYPWFATSCTC